MPKIRLELDRLESYALLVATEAVRPESGEGIPLLFAIDQLEINVEWARGNLVFRTPNRTWTVKVRVPAGGRWPKEGIVLMSWVVDDVDSNMGDVGVGGRKFSFRLVGNPASPGVEFPKEEKRA